MANNNYFKVGSEYFFFDDRFESSTRNAHTNARMEAFDRSISVWRTPVWRGPWDDSSLIGHRGEHEILADIAEATAKLASPDMDARFAIAWKTSLDSLNGELEHRRRRASAA